MNHIIRIRDNFAKFSLWLLPIYILVGVLSFWVGHGEFKENLVLDKYAETISGTITIKDKKCHRWIKSYYAFYEFIPNQYYETVSTTGLMHSKVVTQINKSPPAVLQYGKQRIPKSRWQSLKVGDDVVVEYALHKNTFMTRIYNPFIPWLATFLLFLSGLSAISFIFIIWGKLSNFGRQKRLR
jgi:hypothetical protein